MPAYISRAQFSDIVYNIIILNLAKLKLRLDSEGDKDSLMLAIALVKAEVVPLSYIESRLCSDINSKATISIIMKELEATLANYPELARQEDAYLNIVTKMTRPGESS